MALKPCKECGKEISTEAKVCPNCGKKNPTASESHNWVWVAALIVVLILAVNIFGSRTSSPPPKPKTPEQIAREDSLHASELRQKAIDQQLTAAQLLCRQAAEKSLKSPSTAQFHDGDTYFKDLGKGRSHIQLQVDAENSFGASLRTTIDCKTRQTKTGDVILTSFNSSQR
jgi:RNA polymerase subunit RPABC4/transcription elongation factor Spt4